MTFQAVCVCVCELHSFTLNVDTHTHKGTHGVRLIVMLLVEVSVIYHLFCLCKTVLLFVQNFLFVKYESIKTGLEYLMDWQRRIP